MQRTLAGVALVSFLTVVKGVSVCPADTARLRDSFETQTPGTSILGADGWVGAPEAQAIVSNALYNLDSYGGYLLPGTHTNVVVFSGGITNVRPTRVLLAVTHDTRVAVAIKARRLPELTAPDANLLGALRFDADGLPHAVTNSSQNGGPQETPTERRASAGLR